MDSIFYIRRKFLRARHLFTKIILLGKGLRPGVAEHHLSLRSGVQSCAEGEPTIKGRKAARAPGNVLAKNYHDFFSENLGIDSTRDRYRESFSSRIATILKKKF